MSKFSESLRELRIYNNWDMLVRFGDKTDVTIEYHRPASGRLGWCDTKKTRIWSPRKNPKLNPPEKMVGGSEIKFSGPRRESFPAALAWAMQEFSASYVPSPFGGYLPKHIIKKARDAVKSSPSPTGRAGE